MSITGVIQTRSSLKIDKESIEKYIAKGTFRDVSADAKSSYARLISGYAATFKKEPSAVYALKHNLFAKSLKQLKKSLDLAKVPEKLRKSILDSENLLTAENCTDDDMKARLKKMTDTQREKKKEDSAEKSNHRITKDIIIAMYDYFVEKNAEYDAGNYKGASSSKKGTTKKDKNTLTSILKEIKTSPKNSKGKKYFALVDGDINSVSRVHTKPGKKDRYLDTLPVIFRGMEKDEIKTALKSEYADNGKYSALKTARKNLSSVLKKGSDYSEEPDDNEVDEEDEKEKKKADKKREKKNESDVESGNESSGSRSSNKSGRSSKSNRSSRSSKETSDEEEDSPKRNNDKDDEDASASEEEAPRSKPTSGKTSRESSRPASPVRSRPASPIRSNPSSRRSSRESSPRPASPKPSTPRPASPKVSTPKVSTPKKSPKPASPIRSNPASKRASNYESPDENDDEEEVRPVRRTSRPGTSKTVNRNSARRNDEAATESEDDAVSGSDNE